MIKNFHSTFSLLDERTIPCVGFGTYKVDPDEDGVSTLALAVQMGYRHFDTASLYGTENVLGEAIKESGVDRKEFFITTKVWKDDLEPEKIRASVEKSLQNLGMDYVDLLLIHWPRVDENDEKWEEKLAKAWETFIELKKEGKTKSIGVSNFLPQHFDAIRGMETPVVDQIEFHVGYMQTGAVDYCHRHNIVVEAWAPLGRGKLVENEDVVKIAKKYNVSTAQVLLKFCLQHDVLPIAKSSNYSRMKANMDLFDFELEDEDLNALRAVPDKTGWSGEHPDLAIPKLVIEDEE